MNILITTPESARKLAGSCRFEKIARFQELRERVESLVGTRPSAHPANHVRIAKGLGRSSVALTNKWPHTNLILGFAEPEEVEKTTWSLVVVAVTLDGHEYLPQGYYLLHKN